DARFGERLALFQRRNARDLLLTLAHQPRGAEEHGGALCGRGIAPQAKAALRGIERAVEIVRIRKRQCAERSPGRGIDDAMGTAMADGYLLPVDDHVELGVAGTSAHRLTHSAPRAARAARPRGHRDARRAKW